MKDYYWQRTASGSLEKRPLAKTPPGAEPLFPASELINSSGPNPLYPASKIHRNRRDLNSWDCDRLLSMIYHGTGYIVSFHNKEEQVKAIIKTWYETL